MLSEYKLVKNNYNSTTKKSIFNNQNNLIQDLVKFNINRQSDITNLKNLNEKCKKSNISVSDIYNIISTTNTNEDGRICLENKLIDSFTQIYYTQDMHMKTIEKTCRKITKQFQNENNETFLTVQCSSGQHLYWVMDNESLKAPSTKERINLLDLVTSQINSLTTDYQVDTNLLVTVTIDYTRKVFSNEVLRLITLLEDQIENEYFRGDNIYYFQKFLKRTKSKHTNIINTFRSINKTFIHGDPKIDKFHKNLIESNMKIKETIIKYSRDYERKYNISVKEPPDKKRSLKNLDNNNQIRMSKPMVLKLDYNNKVEALGKNPMFASRNGLNKINSSGIFDLQEIKKRFNIDQNNYQLKIVKNTIGSILNIKHVPKDSKYESEIIEEMILNDIYESDRKYYFFRKYFKDYDEIFKNLEKGWRREKLSKICLKIKIVNQLRKIQRFWRQYKYNKYNRYASMLQNFFKNIQRRSAMKKTPLVFKVFKRRKNFARNIISRNLGLFVKRYRINQIYLNFKTIELEEFHSRYSSHLDKVITIQKYVRSMLCMRKKYKLSSHYKYNQRVKSTQFYKGQWRTYYKKTQTLEKNYFSAEINAKMEVQQIQKYVEEEVLRYDEEWEDYEKRLQEYLNKYTDMKDWVQQTNSQGSKHWVNVRTLKDQKEHPALKVYRTNRKLLKDKADAELATSLTSYTNFKTVLEEYSEVNHQKYSQSLEDFKLTYLAEL